MRHAGRLVTACVLTLLSFACRTPARAATFDPTGYVNPFIGTAVGATDFGTDAGAGNTYPGPVLPGGMIQPGPDTLPSAWNVSGGYDYADHEIRGFSLRRMSGAGCATYRDVLITPTTTSIDSSPVDPMSVDVEAPYRATFSHTQETASPGYYRVTLNPSTPGPIDTEWTATVRTAAARFTYPATRTASLLINAGGSARGDSPAAVSIDPVHRQVSGSAESGGFCYLPNHYRIYFAAQFDRPFTGFGTWQRQQLRRGSTSGSDSSPGDPLGNGHAAWAQTGAYLTFDTSTARSVEMRIGISYVSVANARLNLDAETSGKSFDALRTDARKAWQHALSSIKVSGGPLERTQRFYTALYQALIAPSVFSDADGRYIGMDGAVHTARGYTQYADFSGWDIYRSQVQLLAMLQPMRASSIAESFVADVEQSGWLPKWSVANGQTDAMTGDSADPIIANIRAFGARGFDARRALQAMVKGAAQIGYSPNTRYVERQALPAYLAFGYLPHDLNTNFAAKGSAEHATGLPAGDYVDLPWGSAGTTLEYALDDFAISRLAAALGDRRTCRIFLQRSGNWRNLFNRASGYIEPRLASGLFIPRYNPNYNDSASSQGFAEGDSAQYTWMVPHDPAGLAGMMGGNAVAISRLDSFFTHLNSGSSSPYAYLGNEPSLNSPWLYDWFGQPWKAQQLIRKALLTLYPDNPAGFPGNDDMGEMSSWYVLGALGLYPELPGSDVLAITSPLFPNIVVHTDGGDIKVHATELSPDAQYIGGLRVDGHVSRRPWLRFGDLSSGATLDYVLSATPSQSWGAEPSDAPPSYGPFDTKACS